MSLTITMNGDGSAHYRSQAGDVLDHICWRHYGREAPVAAVLAANPGLAAHGPVLPAGIVIALPPLPAPALPHRERVRLFD